MDHYRQQKPNQQRFQSSPTSPPLSGSGGTPTSSNSSYSLPARPPIHPSVAAKVPSLANASGGNNSSGQDRDEKRQNRFPLVGSTLEQPRADGKHGLYSGERSKHSPQSSSSSGQFPNQSSQRRGSEFSSNHVSQKNSDPTVSHSPLTPGSFCTATSDHDSLSVVNLSGLNSVAGIKERILSKLLIGDDEFFSCSFYLTRIGGGEGRPIGDGELWEACAKSSEGNPVTIFVKQGSQSSDISGDLVGGMSAETFRIRQKEGRQPSNSSRSDKSSHAQFVKTSAMENERLAEASPPTAQGYAPSPSGGTASKSNWNWTQDGMQKHQASNSHGSSSNGGADTKSGARDRVANMTASTPELSGDWERSIPTTCGERRRVPSPQMSSNRWLLANSAPSSQQQYSPTVNAIASGSSTYGNSRSYAEEPRRPQYPTAPLSHASQYHNLALQAQYTPHPSSTAPSPYLNLSPLPSQYATLQPEQAAYLSTLQQQQQRLYSKSVADLRGHHIHESRGPLAPPLAPLQAPIPPQDRHAGVNPGYMTALPPGGSSRLPPPAPPRPFFPGATQSTLSLPHPNNLTTVPPNVYARPPQSHEQNYPPPFDPRVMRSTDNAYSTLPSSGSGPVPHRGSPSLAYQTAGPGQTWVTVQRRPAGRPSWDNMSAGSLPPRPPSHYDPSVVPEVATGIHLRPGETWQQAVQANRRSSDSHPELQAGHYSGRPPVAAHMRSSDPSVSISSSSANRQQKPSGPVPGYSPFNELADQRYGSETVPRRSSDGSAGGAIHERRLSLEESRKRLETIPKSLQPRVSEQFTSPRDSASSFASTSTSPRTHPSVHPANYDDGAYGGLEHEETRYVKSPPSSLRSSVSAGGPLTPANDQVGLGPIVAENKYLDEFDDPIEEDGGTWIGYKGPTKSLASATGHSDAIGATSILGLSITPKADPNRDKSSKNLNKVGSEPLLNGQDSETSTARASDWAENVMNSLLTQDSQDSSTLTNGSTLTLNKAVPNSLSSPPRKVVEVFPTTDEFDDDEADESTFFPGWGPKPSKISSPTSPVGFSLKDEPSSRSPTMNRTKEKRPNLRLRIESPPKSPEQVELSRSSGANSSPEAAVRKSSEPDANRTLPTTASLLPRRARNVQSSVQRVTELEQLHHVDGGVGTGPHVARRGSFAAREKDWAFRPPVETVLENLDAFFPEHDLDKPVFDAPTPAATTPSSSSSPVREIDILPPPRRGGSTLGYKKSIRFVAQDRKRSMQKQAGQAAKAATGIVTNLLRKRSTKLFGSRLEEVTSAQMKHMEATIDEVVPGDDPDNFSFKWIKGELIGRGTYGHVYLAFNVTTAETIAVKQVELPKTRSDKDDQRQQGMVASLKAEIELLKDLDHPNIVLYLGMEETVEHLSIFLEYVPGGSVGRIVRTHGKFEENIIKYFTFQILEGLEYLHGLGILHRDLKADNILTDHEGRCKISDFGTSKRSTDIYNNDVNMSMQGSIFWMAPEVIHNYKQGYSAKADIWSLGCICLEMFAGRRPWSDDEAIQAMFKLGAERLAPPIPPDVVLSPSASHFLDNCLQIDADSRPKAYQLKKHVFLELPETWSFLETTLFLSISGGTVTTRPDEKPKQR